jgi:integrase
MRCSEALGLRWSDINFENNTLSVRQVLLRTAKGITIGNGKSASANRVIHLSGSVLLILKRHKAKQAQEKLSAGESYQNNDLICAHPNGTPLNPNTVSGNFSRIARRRGYNITFHGLRHSHASLLMEAGVNPKVVSERLGHASVSITLDLYSHVVPSLQRQAADAFDAMVNPASCEKRHVTKWGKIGASRHNIR